MSTEFDPPKPPLDEEENRITWKDIHNDYDLIGNDGRNEGSGHLSEEDMQKPSRDDGEMLG